VNKYNGTNERIKRSYFAFLKEAKRQSEDAVDAAAMAIRRFEAYTKLRDFKTFHHEQAIAFKRRLATQDSRATGGKLSKATLRSTLAHLKRFFQWLALQPGYKSRLDYTDAEYFNLSEKDTRIAAAHRPRAVPTIEQIRHVLETMHSGTAIQRRDRALVAFTLLTGARDRAIASMKLKHVDVAAGTIFQDAREVKTKFSKTFTTVFFPVGDDVLGIVVDWVRYLRETLLWGSEDPLFPVTAVAIGSSCQFEVIGLARKHWSNADPIRGIFKAAFAAAGLPYFNPHSFRHALVRLGQTLCKNPEQFKAWSQNLGHEGVLTTFTSYGTVAESRQREIIRSLATAGPQGGEETERAAAALLQTMQAAGWKAPDFG
jgi:integrase/recombinase XerD